VVEVLHKIHETLKAKGEDALAANDLKRAAIDRVFGFEILPAPFVASHLQLGLLLQNLGAPLTDSLNERVGVGTISHVAGKPLDPVKDLKVTAGWGHAGKGGVTMPGKGKIIERDYSTDERKAIEPCVEEPSLTVGLAPRDNTADGALAQASARAQSPFDSLGESTYDVYLNDVAYWKNIPARIWDYTIGGYQVIKKWLSYRELELLDRPLTPEEAREVMNMARRIAAIVLLEPALDANYQAVKEATYSWSL
jgi:hypothetical protein